MKLPDFLMWSTLNTLRQQMGAPLVGVVRDETPKKTLELNLPRQQIAAPPPRPIVPDVPRKKIELPPIEQLRTTGIDVSADEIKTLPDGTREYRGQRVVVYIRDIHSMGEKNAMPKYHPAFCRTLESMHGQNRAGRYVVANGDSGIFEVNMLETSQMGVKVRLDVCQNCLDLLRWKGFRSHMESPQRRALVQSFTLPEFFKKYPRDLINNLSAYSSAHAPVNEYTDDWDRISASLKSKRDYRCERCTLDLTNDRRFLHVHHLNGQRNDNERANLKVLCIGCHAEEPMHNHMRHSPDYQEFQRQHGANRRL